MTIDDQIKYKKLQYDINREAARISDLSSGKIDKYEQLTSEEILASKQKQIIEQTKFTYSPLGKTFEKQIKTIEHQGKNIANSNALVKKYNYDTQKDSQSILKQKKIFNKLADERKDEIIELTEKSILMI